MAKPKGPRPKHTPLRTCMVCRTERAKRELVRIVRLAATPTGAVQVDLTGKVAGRGAYVCRARACWDGLLASPAVTQRLNAALKVTLTGEDLAVLREFCATLTDEE